MSWPWVVQWRWGGLPFRVHASVLLGLLLAAVLFTGTDAVIGYLLLMALHIFGHVVLCWRHQMTLARIDLHAFGGDAHDPRLEPPPQQREAGWEDPRQVPGPHGAPPAWWLPSASRAAWHPRPTAPLPSQVRRGMHGRATWPGAI